MPAVRLLLVVVLALSWSSHGQQPRPSPRANAGPPARTLEELRERLARFVEQPRFDAAMWGIKVAALDSGVVLFERYSKKLFVPASNSKLFTVALALDELGPEYRIRTSVYAREKPDGSGVLNSDLIVFGRGDPCITARLHSGSIAAALEPLARAITNAGIRRVAGDLVGDSSYFVGPEYGAGWTWDDPQYYYGAELSSLTINDNILQAQIKPGPSVGAPCHISLAPPTDYIVLSNRTETTGKDGIRRISVYRPLGRNVVFISGKVPLEDTGASEDITVHDPAGLFIGCLREALASHGVQVDGKLRTRTWLDRMAAPLDYTQFVEVATIESLTMGDLAREVQKPSQNLYADLLLAHVGEKNRASETSPDTTSEELGIAALNRFVRRTGIQRAELFFEEGSGLSRDNLVTPGAIIKLLQFMAKQDCGAVFLKSLPIAGVDGTLRSRMKGTSAQQNVRAKTGTLRWANSLSGYVKTAAGEDLVFSLILNRYYNVEGRASARTELDAIAVMLASFEGRTSAGTVEN
jgi:D-alanyl-D-alanine carboxypeptidase/D-alanyl-D-alanine-endopeptidase (penicillin-binding protein 4)